LENLRELLPHKAYIYLCLKAREAVNTISLPAAQNITLFALAA